MSAAAADDDDEHAPEDGNADDDDERAACFLAKNTITAEIIVQSVVISMPFPIKSANNAESTSCA